MGRVVVLGASLSDMNLRLDRLPRPGETRLGSAFFRAMGGKGANQAVAAARLGAEVTFLSGFGDDDAGREMLDRYRAEGLNLDHAHLAAGEASGVALILVGDDGENLIGVAMGPNARLDLSYVDALPESVFAGPGVFLASLEVPLGTVVRAIERAKTGGMTVVLNPAPAPLALVGHPILARVDVLTPNQTEAAVLAELATDWSNHEPDVVVDALLTRGAGGIVLTLGVTGCLVAGRLNRDVVPAFRARAVDTVGAGDAFNAALAAALADGMPLLDAARRANAAASIAVTRPGAQGALPSRDEVDRVLVKAERAADPYRDGGNIQPPGRPGRSEGYAAPDRRQ